MNTEEIVPLDVTKDVVEKTEPSHPTYFTEGEMLPWKGRWFKVHLNNERKVIELEMLKPTAASVKRAAREERWLKQHPRSQKAAMQVFEQVKQSLQQSAVPQLPAV